MATDIISAARSYETACSDIRRSTGYEAEQRRTEAFDRLIGSRTHMIYASVFQLRRYTDGTYHVAHDCPAAFDADLAGGYWATKRSWYQWEPVALVRGVLLELPSGHKPAFVYRAWAANGAVTYPFTAYELFRGNFQRGIGITVTRLPARESARD